MRSQSYLSSKDSEENGEKEEPTKADSKLLNAEELSKLKAFLRTFQDGASCSTDQQGISLTNCSFSASKIDRDNMWILDSGATDHMTPNPNFFETYEPLTTAKQITIANGVSVPITGTGTIHISPSLTLSHALYVPNLTTNLISIHQLTKYLNCYAVFSSYLCKFQAKDTGQMIGVAKEYNGLYILQGENPKPKRRRLGMAYSTETSTNFSSIWLHHLRLGHPPFILLKNMFPSLFRYLEPSDFQCDVCVMAKHH